MDGERKVKLINIIIFCFIVLWLSLSVLIWFAVDEVAEVGLESVFEEIWCGTSGCDEKETP